MRNQPEGIPDVEKHEGLPVLEMLNGLETREITRNISKGSSIFTKEFNKYLKNFLVGGFSFVAALLWRDAINNTLNNENVQGFFTRFFPFLSEGALMYLTAFLVTVVAVFFIVLIENLLKSKS